jgi:hypothetical protein
MDLTSWIGSIGVALLLIAFFLNLFKFLSQENALYKLLNLVGAGLAGYASWLLDFMPFVILEAIWFVVTALSLWPNLKKRISA